jgi:hypothetical protein
LTSFQFPSIRFQSMMDPPAYVNPQRLEQRLVPTRRSRGVACNREMGASGEEQFRADEKKP